MNVQWIISNFPWQISINYVIWFVILSGESDAPLGPKFFPFSFILWILLAQFFLYHQWVPPFEVHPLIYQLSIHLDRKAHCRSDPLVGPSTNLMFINDEQCWKASWLKRVNNLQTLGATHGHVVPNFFPCHVMHKMNIIFPHLII